MNVRTTLFVTDLDGTLLRPDATLDPDTARRINALMKHGVRITYATARTVRSVSHILHDIDFTLSDSPAALMNGVLLRDMRENRYVRAAEIDPATAQTVLECMTKLGASPFVYSLDEENPTDGDPLTTCYREIANEPMRRFYEERVERYRKPFLKINTAADIPGRIIYFCLIADEAMIRTAAGALETIPGIRFTYYRDSYAENTWYLEAFSPDASKKHATETLRTITGAETVIAFGDNRNDIPMFEAADHAVAAETAVEEAKAAADETTPTVIGWIEAYCKEKFGIQPE
ncbi:MAG: HAD hydrolase family protein [Clostridia bacterium]|nr:HAD hydrolase family protein [Clostridia bacterium]MBQ8333476.1 HAD hydrolase family protein [Clostridia bacterium]MBQ8370647.1 HAD hydrolase family protein [Clostridia bacterium]MBQ8512367.1 HAD hydrolase family protein [Clostridia bacterium]